MKIVKISFSLLSRIIVESFGSSFKTLKVNDLKLPDQAWKSNDLFGYVEKLVNKLSVSILEVHKTPSITPPATTGIGNDTRKSRGVTKKKKTHLKKDDNHLELPLNKTGTEFSGTVRALEILIMTVNIFIGECKILSYWHFTIGYFY